MRLSVVALLGGAAAACSADTTRFGSAAPAPAGAPAYTGSVAAAPTGAVQSGPIGGAPSYPAPAYGAPATYGAAPAPAPYGAPQQLASVSPANLPPQQYGAAPAQPYPAPQYGTAPYTPPAAPPAGQPLYGTQPPAAAPHAPVAAAAGSTHVVQPGQTLSSISRSYGISRAALASANGLDFNAQVQIGRKLVIPGAGAPGNPVAAAPKPATHDLAAATPVPPLAAPKPATPPAPYPATGEAHPAPGATPPATAAKPAMPPVQQAIDKTPTIALVKPTETPDDVRTDASQQFRWPVRGRVISGFGPKPGGQKNEGINVSVPEGTPVKAAEDGVVAYAGSELKGYGNLVLIKHPDGYVTAYAHNSALDVKKGDTVKRGQVIAKAGQTGNVTSPQVHFEIRKGSEPVDPSQYLAGL